MNNRTEILSPWVSSIWKLSLFSFIIAALTGFLFRLGMTVELPFGLELSNLRHAHSHLMLFNWICPPLMAWMAVSVSDGDGRPDLSFKPCLYTMMTLGFITYPLFLMFGYRPVEILGSEIPLAAAFSGLVMLTWYWFAINYFRARIDTDDRLQFLLFDASILALVISSLGAWGVSIAQFMVSPGSLVPTAMTGFFLSVFTEGWILLSVLGVLQHYYNSNGDKNEDSEQKSLLYVPILFGSMLLFPFSMSRSLLTVGMQFAAYSGLILTGVGLALHLKRLFHNMWLSGFIGKSIALLILLKLVFMILAIIPNGVWVGSAHGVRILYLHTLLLGIASVAIWRVYSSHSERNTVGVFIGSVALILLSLAFVSGYWPKWLIPPGLYYWITAIAILPVFPSVWFLIKAYKKPLRKKLAGNNESPILR